MAKTKRGKPQSAIANLERWGVEAFLPEILRPDRRQGVMEPLFPGYLFCRFDPASPLSPIVRWSPGVAYFLGTTDGLTCLPDELIAHLRDRVAWWNNGGYQSRFHPEERVVVQEGPLAGFEGIFRRYLPARQRCEVLLEVAGRLARAEVPEFCLRSVGPRIAWPPGEARRSGG